MEEEKQLAEFLSQLGIGASAASDYAAALVAEGFDTTVAFASLTAEELHDDFEFKRGHLRMVEHEREREPEPEPESPVLEKQAASEVLLQRQHRRRQLIGSGTGSSLQSDVVTTTGFSEAIAGHVQPGATLAKFAMVCREWWSAARVLPAYHSPWDAEYQLWRTAGSQRRKPGSQAWPQYMEAVLEWQLARYLCRLPELEPDLQSPVLVERAEHYATRLREALSQKAGDESEGEIRDIYDVEKEALRSLNLPLAKRQEVLRNHPEARRRRRVLRDCIHDISDAAYRRLARLGGVVRFSRLLYDEAREGLKRCLEILLRGAVVYSEHAYHRTTGPCITSADVAHTLQLHGRPVCSLTVSTSGFFDRKPQEDESDDATSIEKDDLTHPQPQQQILAYVSAFASLLSEMMQDFMCDHIFSKAADVLLRRAVESFLVEVFAKANEPTALENMTPELQVQAFRTAQRSIIDGMWLQASSCGPPGCELNEELITAWSSINYLDADTVAKLAGNKMEIGNLVQTIDSDGSSATTMVPVLTPVPSDNDDDDYDPDDSDEDHTHDFDDDIDEQEFLQECKDYELGFEVETSDEEESFMTVAYEDQIVREDTTSNPVVLSISAPKLAPRFASYSAGRSDRAESQVRLRKRGDEEERLEDLCSGFSATPKAAGIS